MENGTLLKASRVHKSYRTRAETLHVLKGIDMEVQRGEIVSIVGPSGSGKSTLLHILGTLDVPDEGEVLLGNVRLFEQTDSEMSRIRNREIGFVFQFHHLLPEFTALENVMMPELIGGLRKEVVEEKGRSLLREVGLFNRENHRPFELSGGERQRVAVARALIHSPRIILADEPTGNLDTASGTAIVELLISLSRERVLTFLIVTHNEAIARRGDRILNLVDGKIQNESSSGRVQ